MLSIRRRLVDRASAPQEDVALHDDALRLREMLSRAAEARRPLPDNVGTPDYKNAARALVERLEQATTPAELAALAVDSLSSAEDYIHRFTESSDEQSAQVQSMFEMLTQTVADLGGQSEASVQRLVSSGFRIEKSAGVEDLRKLKDHLAECLTAIKEAAAHQRKEPQAPMERPAEDAKIAPPVAGTTEMPPVNGPGQAGAFLAAIKIQHADHLLKRFGEAGRDELLSIVGKGLESAVGPRDRLLRWKGASFVLFATAPDGIGGVRRRVAAATSRVSQRYVELSKNSALLAVSLDWTVIAQSQFSTLDGAFEAVDAFLK
jgi:hypothetical protein